MRPPHKIPRTTPLALCVSLSLDPRRLVGRFEQAYKPAAQPESAVWLHVQGAVVRHREPRRRVESRNVGLWFRRDPRGLGARLGQSRPKSLGPSAPWSWSTGGRLIGERQFRQPSDKSGEVWNVRFQMRLLIGFFPGVSPKAPWVRAEEWRPQVLRTVIGRSAAANSGQDFEIGSSSCGQPPLEQGRHHCDRHRDRRPLGTTNSTASYLVLDDGSRGILCETYSLHEIRISGRIDRNGDASIYRPRGRIV